MKARHYLEYGLFLPVKGMIRALPHRAVRHFGQLLGEIAYRLDRRHRWVVESNLKLALPELSHRRRRRIARRCFRHFGGMICDMLSLARFDAVELCRHLTLEGWEHLRTAEEQGRGVLILTAHLGNWEVLAHPMALYHGGMIIVSRPADNPLLETELRSIRERFGNSTIYKRGAVRGIARAVRRRERVVLLIDQRVHPNEGIEVPFFGHPAMTTPLLARLSLRHRVPVVPMFGFPRPRGRFLVVARPPILPEGTGDEAVAALTGRYLAVVEEEIRHQPELWLWMHERWIWIDEHERWRKRRSTTIP